MRGLYVCTISYVEAIDVAERRMRSGEHQHLCGQCSKWFWPLHPDEHGDHRPLATSAELGLPHVRRKRRKCETCVFIEAEWERTGKALSRRLTRRTSH